MVLMTQGQRGDLSTCKTEGAAWTVDVRVQYRDLVNVGARGRLLLGAERGVGVSNHTV